jgi:hypothetical protein
MDVVLPLGTGSKNDNLEIRYCLRSIEKYLSDLENIFVIGACPDFLQNIIHIPATDIPDRKRIQYNIFQKIKTACYDKRISDDFYCTSDDCFLLREYIRDYNHRGLLSENIGNYTSTQTYGRTLKNTLDLLPDGYDYGHGPIVYNKEKFFKSVCTAPWQVNFGYSIKALYCNMNGLVDKYMLDCNIKSYTSYNEIGLKQLGRPYFAVNDAGLNEDMKKFLHDLFPDKSQFEK